MVRISCWVLAWGGSVVLPGERGIGQAHHNGGALAKSALQGNVTTMLFNECLGPSQAKATPRHRPGC